MYANLLSPGTTFDPICFDNNCDFELSFTENSELKLEDAVEEYEDLGKLDNAIIVHVKSPYSESSLAQKWVLLSNTGYAHLRPWHDLTFLI